MTTAKETPGRVLSSQQIARAAGIVMLAYLASGVLGIVRQSAISSAYGAVGDLDAFVAAQRVPETLFVLVAGGALGSAFIPVFTRFLALDDEDGAWRLASGVISLMMVAALILALMAFTLATPIMEQLLLNGAAAETQSLAVELMRIMLVTVIIFSISGLLMGILNAHQHFLAPALAPSMYNLGLIFGALFLTDSMGVHGLAWGSVIGAALHLLVQVPAVTRLEPRLKPLFDWRVPGVTEVLLLMGPRVLGLGVVQVSFWVNTMLASHMMEGSAAALTWAFTLMFTVLGILGQSVGTAVFPTLASLSATKNTDELRRLLASALGRVLFLSIPAGIGLAVIGEPLIAVLFERGEWTSTHTAGTAWALAFFSIGLAGHAVLEILVRAFYALHDTWTPVKIGTASMLLNIGLSLVLIRAFGYPGSTDFAQGPIGGLALAMSISTAVESTLLWVILRGRIGGLNEPVVLGNAARTLLASLAMAGAVAVFLLALPDLARVVQTAGGVLIGTGVFVVVALLLRIPEATTLPRMVLRRVRS